MTDVMDVSDAARSGRLDLLLVQNDDLPNLTLTSATLTAVQRGCPVLHLTSLRKRIVGVVRNPLLKAMGFRVGGYLALSSLVFVANFPIVIVATCLVSLSLSCVVFVVCI